jgi:nucleoid-associated protein YgaU
MISRPAIIGVVGAIVVIAAVLLNFFVIEDAPPPNGVAESNKLRAALKKTKAAVPTTITRKPVAETKDDRSVLKTEPEAATKNPIAPIFDIVRVDPEGNTVIAGRARPNTVVRILDGDEVLGEVISDGRGDWVFVPGKRLEPGSRVLTLSAGGDGEDRKESEDAIVLVIPKPGENIAGVKAGTAGASDRTPLAMVVPRDQTSSAPTKVIQAPKTSATNNAPAPVVRTFPESEKPVTGGQATPDSVADVAKRPVGLDTVDYDDNGDVVFSGKVKPGEKVQVYVDNKLVGKADADAQGRWTLRPSTKVAPGEHDIRVDKVAETGKVLARIELPFVRAEPFTALPNQTIVIIQPGNNLWRIASKVYGDGLRYTDIFQANADQIRNPDLIYPGQVFGLPRTN